MKSPEPIIGSCSFCGYLAFCQEKLVDRRRRVLICADCQAELDNNPAPEQDNNPAAQPMLPLAPLKRPAPRPPARETGAETRKKARG